MRCSFEVTLQIKSVISLLAEDPWTSNKERCCVAVRVFFFMIKKGLVEFVTMKNLFRSNFQNSNNLMVY